MLRILFLLHVMKFWDDVVSTIGLFVVEIRVLIALWNPSSKSSNTMSMSSKRITVVLSIDLDSPEFPRVLGFVFLLASELCLLSFLDFSCFTLWLCVASL